MLPVFFAFAQCYFAAIDIGGQYARIAINTIGNSAKLVTNEQDKVMTPSAIGLRLAEYSEKHIKLNEIDNVEVRIGEPAVKLLKHKPLAGAQFLPRIIGRNESVDFELPTIMNSTELLALFFHKLFKQPQLQSAEAIAVNVPNFWTLSQRDVVFQAMELAKLPFFGLVDDTSAVIQLYTIQHSKKFIYESHGVLFVDFGATGLRAYRILFTTNGTDPLGTQTSYEFTERVSGIKMIRKVAEHDSCSFSKAQKRLIANPDKYSDLMADDMEIVYDVIQAAVDGEVDEVQLLGGASRFPFVIEAIKSVVGYTDVLNEMPQMDSIALGTVHVVQSTMNQSRFKLVPVVKPPVYTSEIECGRVRASYCKHRGTCQDHVILHNAKCSNVVIRADRQEIPEGTSDVIGLFKLTNISKFKVDAGKQISGIISMRAPAPVMYGALWCEAGTRRCEVIDVDHVQLRDPERKRKAEFVEAVIQAEKDKIKKQEFRAQMINIIDQTAKFTSDESTVYEITDTKFLEMLREAQRIVDFAKDMSVPDMRQFLIALETRAKSLGIGV